MPHEGPYGLPAELRWIRVHVFPWREGTTEERIQRLPQLLTTRTVVPFTFSKPERGVHKMPVHHVQARVLPSEVNAQLNPRAEASPRALIPLVRCTSLPLLGQW